MFDRSSLPNKRTDLTDVKDVKNHSFKYGMAGTCWHFQKESMWFSLAGRTFFIRKNIPLHGQIRRKKSSSQPLNLPGARPIMKPLGQCAYGIPIWAALAFILNIVNYFKMSMSLLLHSELLCQNTGLTVSILDALSNLSLHPDLLAEVSHTSINRLIWGEELSFQVNGHHKTKTTVQYDWTAKRLSHMALFVMLLTCTVRGILLITVNVNFVKFLL